MSKAPKASSGGSSGTGRGRVSSQPVVTTAAGSGGAAPLSLEALLYLVPLDATPESMKALDLKRRSIASLPLQIKLFKHLRKLDLSHNALSSCRALAPLQHIAHLNVCDNALTSLEGLEAMAELTVLQVSNNQLTTLQGLDACVGTLKAFIANGNRLSLVAEAAQHGKPGTSAGPSAQHENCMVLARMAQVETVVMSRNPLLTGFKEPDVVVVDEQEGDGEQGHGGASPAPAHREEATQHPLSVFASMPQLRKLSLSECHIASLPSRWFLPLAAEVRLAHNQIATLPDGVIMRSVKTLDMSNNHIHNVVALRRCKYLQNLSLHGNPVTTATDHHDLADDATHLPWWTHVKTHMILSRMFSELQVLDGQKFVPLTKEEYLKKKHESEKKAAHAARGVAKGDLASAELESMDASGEQGREKRPRQLQGDEPLPDVVLEVPEAAAPRSIVRRERTVPQHQIARNTAATGSAAMAMLKKTRAHAPTAW